MSERTNDAVIVPRLSFHKAYRTIRLKTLLAAYLKNKIITFNFRNSQQRNFQLSSLSDLNTPVTSLVFFAYENFY